MDSKTVKLKCLILGELENEPIFKKVACSFKGFRSHTEKNNLGQKVCDYDKK